VPRCKLPALTDPTARFEAFTEFASPSVSPGGNGNCETAPFCQITGNRLVPKSVVAAVPTTMPLSFALFETAWPTPGKVRQANNAAVECPGKRLTSASANRSAHCNPAVRHTEPLGRIVAGINHADVIDLILRKSSREPARFPSAIDSNSERSGLQTQVTKVEVRRVDFEVVDFLYYLSTASGIFPRRCKVDKATRQISGFGLMSWFHVFSKDGKAKSTPQQKIAEMVARGKPRVPSSTSKISFNLIALIRR